MKQTKRPYLRMGGLVLVLLLALSAVVTIAGAVVLDAQSGGPRYAPEAAIASSPGCAGGAGSVSCTLYAVTGTLTLPDSTEVPIWGYNEDGTPGSAQLPGPTIIANEGDEVSIILYNTLPITTALTFPGQELIPDLTGIAPGGNNSTSPYTFTVSAPGTYLYEAGLLPNAAQQVAMGMFGALVVRPASGDTHAYDASSAFDVEALVMLSEIDVNLNADPANFDMRDYSPQYRLINGKAYSQTENIIAGAGNRVLLRYINAGIQQHTMGVLGLDQEVIARDASLRPYPQRELAESIGPGRTTDAIVTIPSPAPAGGASYALYDTSLLLHNNNASFGGMLTFLTVADGGPTPIGPTTLSVNLNPASSDGSGPISLSAEIPDAVNAQYRIDDGGFVPMTGPIVDEWSASIDVSLMPTGNYIVYVRGQDSVGNWGSFNIAFLHLDKDGPVSGGITLFPNPSDGSVDVAISATGDDTTTGGSNIQAAEYSIHDLVPGPSWPGVPMTVNISEPIASLDASIPAAAIPDANIEKVVSVRSQDAFGHWGDPVTTTLVVDISGPLTSGVVVNPGATDGTVPYNPSIFAVRVDADVVDTTSTIQRVEGYFDGPDPGLGEGFPLSPSDGLFNELSESAYAYIPMPTITALSVGMHDIWIRAQDASGNWGAAVAGTLEITAP